MTRDFNNVIIRSVPEKDSGVKVYTNWESVRIQAAIQFTSDFISSSVDTSGVPVSELAVTLADKLVERLKAGSEEFPPTEQHPIKRPDNRPLCSVEWTSKFEPIKPAPEFKFKEGELVKVKQRPGSVHEIMNRKYTINDKVAYLCKGIGWMFESELQRYDKNDPKEPTQ